MDTPLASNKITPVDTETYRSIVEAAAQENGVDPDLVMKVIKQESVGDPHATSVKGAKGLMQIMPEHYGTYGITDPYDPTQSIKAGTKLLKELLDKYNGDTRLALVDYNGGPKAVEAYKAGRPYKETTGYLAGTHADSERPHPFDLDSFLKDDHPTASQPFDLDAFVKGQSDTKSIGTPEQAKGFVDAVRESMPMGTYDAIAGAVKGLGSTISHVTGLDQAPIEVGGQPLNKLLEPSNTTQSIGKFGEQAAEFAIPATGADALALKLTGNASPALRLMTRSAAQGAVGAADAKAHGQSPIIGGIMGATSPIIGEIAGAAIPAAIKALGRGTARQALKPTYTALMKMGGFEGPAPNAEALLDFILKNKLATAADAEAFIRQLEQQKIMPIARAADARGALTDAPARAQAALDAKIAASKASAMASDVPHLEAAKQTLAEGQGSHSFTNPVWTMQPSPNGILGPNGQVVQTPVLTLQRQLKPAMGVEETLTSARGAQTDAAYGIGVKPKGQLAAEKAVEIAERDAAKAAAPELEPALAEQRMAIHAKKVLGQADVREGNRDMMSLKNALMITHAATSPGTGTLMLGDGILKYAGVKGGIVLQDLAKALERKDVGLVTNLLRNMGYGAALEALPKRQ